MKTRPCAAKSQYLFSPHRANETHLAILGFALTPSELPTSEKQKPALAGIARNPLSTATLASYTNYNPTITLMAKRQKGRGQYKRANIQLSELVNLSGPNLNARFLICQYQGFYTLAQGAFKPSGLFNF